MVTHHRDKAGEPIDFEAWHSLFTNRAYSVIAEYGDKEEGLHVITEWSGFDDGVPVAPMWTTHVRVGAGRWLEYRLFWPATLADAQAQHEQVLAEHTPA